MLERRRNNNNNKLRDIPERGSLKVSDEIKNIISDKFNLSNRAYAVASGLKYQDLGYFYRDNFAENLNDYINNPVYVIEYLLRKYYDESLIDINSFDITANSLLVKSMKYNFSLTERVNIISLLNELLMPFFGVLYFENSKIKITTLWDKNVVATIDKSLVKDGAKDIKIGFDNELYSVFDFESYFIEQTNEFLYKAHIDKNNSDIQFINLDPTIICNDIETNLKIKKSYLFQFKYALYITIRPIFEYFTKIKMIIDLKLSVKDGIVFELGDYVKINLPDIMPSNYNNNKKFVVIGKEVQIGSNPYVFLRLMESPFSGYTI